MKTLLTILMCCCVLAGCDKGPKSSGSSTVKTLSGFGSKGIVQNGVVKLYRVMNGAVGTVIATTTTADDGSFALAPAEADLTSMVWLELRGAEDGSTRVQCDLASCGVYADSSNDDLNDNGLVDVGEWVNVDSSFRMTAWLVWSGNETAISINPVTHAIASQYSSAPSASTLAAQYAAVQEQLGLTVSPAHLPVLDVLTSDDTAGLQNQLLAAAVASVYGSDAETIEQQLTAVGTGVSTVPMREQSLTRISERALAVARRLPENTRATLVSHLDEVNQNAADSENRLSADDLPMLPPLQ